MSMITGFTQPSATVAGLISAAAAAGAGPFGQPTLYRASVEVPMLWTCSEQRGLLVEIVILYGGRSGRHLRTIVRVTYPGDQHRRYVETTVCAALARITVIESAVTYKTQSAHLNQRTGRRRL